ncbi:hypothetical protein RIF29_21426 [Crotalaria pallida]|uniref:Uncharacterized protein n=1 Tax=Crotalaria pallida TaxID=3830 RepID=A0AAN9I8E4_CROPI
MFFCFFSRWSSHEALQTVIVAVAETSAALLHWLRERRHTERETSKPAAVAIAETTKPAAIAETAKPPPHGLLDTNETETKFLLFSTFMPCTITSVTFFNYSSGQPAPKSITDKIYGNTLSISEIKIADIPDVDLSNVGSTKYGSFSAEVIDPVSYYLELFKTVFDFQLIRGLLSRPDFRLTVAMRREHTWIGSRSTLFAATMLKLVLFQKIVVQRIHKKYHQLRSTFCSSCLGYIYMTSEVVAAGPKIQLCWIQMAAILEYVKGIVLSHGNGV